MSIQLIADSGSTKTSWCLIDGKSKKNIITQGISPYFLDYSQICSILEVELLPKIKNKIPNQIHFYGTGCGNAKNIQMVKKALRHCFNKSIINVNHDLLGAARALCGEEKGIVCILGTGSNSCYFNGKKIVKNNPSLGYVLGDEGSGAHLGKKVLQHFLYNTFEPDLMDRFQFQFNTSRIEILDTLYKQSFPNRYLASFSTFLVENRGHFMVENIIEDGFNEFFFNHVLKYRESWSMPIHFTGSIAHGFKDRLKEICNSFELQLGKVCKDPMEGLIKFHI